MTWLDLLGAAAFTGSIGLCTGVLIGGRIRDVYEARDAARTDNTRYEQQVNHLQHALLAERRHRWDRGETMICPPCAEAADMDAQLGVPVSHDPTICRDHDIQPHGCPCEHGSHLAGRASP